MVIRLFLVAKTIFFGFLNKHVPERYEVSFDFALFIYYRIYDNIITLVFTTINCKPSARSSEIGRDHKNRRRIEMRSDHGGRLHGSSEVGNKIRKAEGNSVFCSDD